MGCRASVEAELKGVAGARFVDVDLPKQSATVIFDPAQTNVAALKAAMATTGYAPKSESLVEG